MLESLTSRQSGMRRTLLRAVFCAALLIVLEPCCFAQSRSSLRMIRSRAREIQAAQRKEVVSSLQAQLRAANRELSDAQTQLAASQSEVQKMKSQLDTAKKREADQVKAVQEATRSLRGLEEKIISSHSAETPLGRALVNLSESQQHLNAELRRFLGERLSANDQGEFDFSREYLKLTQVQRDKLKDDAGFQAAQRRLDGAKYDLDRLKKQLLEVHPEWKRSRESVRSKGEELKALQASRKSAAADLAIAMRNLTRVRASAILAQSAVNNLIAELASLGVSPD